MKMNIRASCANYDYLLQMYDNLSDCSEKKQMYKTMYDMFRTRTNHPLDKEHKDIGFEEFQVVASIFLRSIIEEVRMSNASVGYAGGTG